MSKYTSEEVQKRFLTLPPELREAISSINISDKIFDTAEKHGIKIDGMGALSIEVGYVMLGLTRPKDFVDQLASALEVDKKSAQAIADDINREIFYPVREHLRNLHNAPNEFPEPKLDTPASIFAEKMAGVAREPMKEVHIIDKDAGKSHFLGEERLPGVPGTKPKDSFAELRAELQREIEEEHTQTEVRSTKQELRGVRPSASPIPPKQILSAPSTNAPSQKSGPVPAHLSEQRPSKAFALDEKESPPPPTPSRVGTPTSPPASFGAAIPSSKPSLSPASLGPQPIPPRTQTPPAPSPATPTSSIKNDGLLPAFRGYKMGAGMPAAEARSMNQESRKTPSAVADKIKPPAPMNPTQNTPPAMRPPSSAPQVSKPPSPAQHGPDPYREPAN